MLKVMSVALLMFISIILFGTTAEAKNKGNQFIQVSLVNNTDNFLWTDQADKIGKRDHIILEYKDSKPAVRRIAILSDTKDSVEVSYFLLKYNASHVEKSIYLREGLPDDNNASGRIWVTLPYWGYIPVSDWNDTSASDQALILDYYKIVKRTKTVVLLESRIE